MTVDAEGESPDSIARLLHTVHALEDRVNRLQDEAEITRLQHVYGYYLDYRHWSEIFELFSDDAVVEVGERGVYRGRPGVEAIFRDILGHGREGLRAGEVHNHMQLQGVIDIDEHRTRAKGRWRTLVQIVGVNEDGSRTLGAWGEGLYENEYVRDRGTWRISVLRWLPSFFGMLPEGAMERPGSPGVSTIFPPTAPSSLDIADPNPHLLPYHYPNPVTRRAATFGEWHV